MADVINLQQVLEALAASGADTDALLTAVGEMSSVPAGGFNTPVNTLYTLESANGTPLANVVNIGRQAAEQAGQVGNSNIAGAAGTFTNSQGASAAAGQTAGASTFFGGAKKFLNHTVAGTEHFGVGTLAASIAAVCVGAKAGKTFDSLIYKTGKLFGFEMADSLNPETWDSITYDMADTGLEGVYKRGIQLLLGLNQDTNKLEAYMPKDAFNYLAYVLAKAGYFDTGTETADAVINNVSWHIPWFMTGPATAYPWQGAQAWGGTHMTVDNGYYAFLFHVTGQAGTGMCVCGDHSASSVLHWTRENGTYEGNWGCGTKVTINGLNAWFGTSYTNYPWQAIALTALPYVEVPNESQSGLGQAAWAVVHGNRTSTQPVEGVGDQTGATIPPINSSSSQQDVADAMNNTFPDLEGNRVEMPVAVPATVPKPVTYVQVPLPSTVAGNNPTIEPTATPQADPNIDPQTASDPLSALLLKLLTQPYASNMPDPANDPEEYPEGKPEEKPNTNPPDVGTGTTPPLVVPVGSASALWTVYNPTMSEINALGAWLWSSNFIDQLLKMFSDPMQAIIGVHKVFASPAVSGRSNIVVGYLDSGVAANVVGSQYTTINCGTVKLSEYFGNVFDYSPHTKVSLFLPFIGVVDLDVGEVMRANISVIYHVDVFSGACLAEVSVTRDGGAGGVLYTYSGDAAVRYPLSSGSYMGMVSGVLSVVGGIAGTIASGGSLAPALLGGAAGIGNAHTSVQHSGSISGNAGAMGGKKPYLIIRRPQTAMANNYEHYSGVGSNQRVTVFQMDGYFRLEDIRNVNIKGATDTEIEEIVRALEEGVLM